jgi:hypothetical protein
MSACSRKQSQNSNVDKSLSLWPSVFQSNSSISKQIATVCSCRTRLLSLSFQRIIATNVLYSDIGWNKLAVGPSIDSRGLGGMSGTRYSPFALTLPRAIRLRT